MDRLLDIAPENRTPELSAVFDRVAAGRGRIPTPYRVWIHSPVIASGMESIGTFLNKRSHLTRREIEIGILLIAKHWDGEYVLQNHTRGARRAGIDDATIEMVKNGQRPKLPDEHEQAFYDFAATVVSGVTPSDEDFARYERILKREGIAEALVLLGYYGSVALAMKVHKVQPSARDD